jgi:hypothetical protein
VLFHTGKPEQLTANALVDKPLTQSAASANTQLFPATIFFNDVVFIIPSLSLYFFGQKFPAKK